MRNNKKKSMRKMNIVVAYEYILSELPTLIYCHFITRLKIGYSIYRQFSKNDKVYVGIDNLKMKLKPVV